MQIAITTAIIQLLCLNVTASPHHGRPVQPATNINPPQNNNQTGKDDNLSNVSPPTSINLTSKKKLPANNNRNSENIDPSLIPIFSIKSGTGVGANGVAIPNTCPPARGDFISKLSANIAAGNVLGTPILFNTDLKVQDIKTNKDRATAMIITLQSFSGVKGVGCPGASTPELISQQKTGVVVSK
ncbi:uncharacterized protein RAG0_03998 [Rhynchosporium agropyri]|uniref:GEgh 16 protein n=1 Tax=Rhynchosporium agropyri TaxID=914238 RepID=A0A1E1K7J0_9HELO|nr:uncharacterized protein RAG0_03998 [Rhynchosporium agropyri]